MSAPAYRRAPDVRQDTMGADTFLVAHDDEAIYHLNAVGGAVWSLLEQPISEREITDVLRNAFPDVPADIIRRDIRALLARLVDRGLALLDKD